VLYFAVKQRDIAKYKQNMNHVPVPKNNYLKKNANIKPAKKTVKTTSAIKNMKAIPLKKNQKVESQ